MRSVGWIYEGNLVPFLGFCANLAGYDLSEEEIASYRLELRGSDSEESRWVTVRLPGKHELVVMAAIDPGSSVVHLKVTAPNDLFFQILGVASFLGHYRVEPPDA